MQPNWLQSSAEIKPTRHCTNKPHRLETLEMVELKDRYKTPAADTMVGISRQDITPPEGIRAKNWGPAEWEESVGQHHSMTLTALAIGGELQDTMLVIGLDATWWRREEDERNLREMVLAATGVPPSNLMIALSHTHAGPSLSAGESHLPGGHLISGYLATIGQAAVTAASQAMSSRQAARIEWAFGTCGLASNRELVVDGKAVVGYVPGVDADDTVAVARISTMDGASLGTVVNYACHPTTLSWQNRAISPDYVGAMRALVEAETGQPCLFFQGASGDLAPREQYTGDLSVADRHGLSLGHAVLAALHTLPLPAQALELSELIESGAPLALWTSRPEGADSTVKSLHSTVTLDLHAPSLEELEKGWGDINPVSLKERQTRALALRETLGDRKITEYPVWVWRVGDGVIVGTPGEPYSQLQKNLRRRFPHTALMVVNFVNGPGFMYVPTADAYERGAYQSWQTLFAPGSLERVEEHTAEMIRVVLS